MTTARITRNGLLVGSTMLLAACGGGGGGVASIPAPPVSPTPTPTPTPPPSAAPAGAWYDTSRSTQFRTLASFAEHVADSSGRVTSAIASEPADQVSIEYSAAQQSYLVTLPGMQQGRLVGRDLVDPAGHVVAAVDLNPQSTGFTYANIGHWVSGAGTSDLKIGDFAFGTPTAAGDVPLTGTATYAGEIAGQTDEGFVRASEGFVSPSTVTGTVAMSFDFAAARLSGEIRPLLQCWGCFETPLPTLQFTQTAYSAGSTSYSGKFDTTLGGPNWFNGIFAGPGAAETMAKFQAPYLNPYTLDPNDPHVMSGVWVAKRSQ